jgi:EAL domain-containing protein (putative c-di-GMP-specific phosphodiesterase class I)
VERLPALLAPGAIELHFQPICPIQRPCGGIRFEALLRMKDQDLGEIHPELFFLACERVGKAALADRAVIVHALNCSVPWAYSGIGCRGISVNVAPSTLLEPGFAPWLGALMRERNWPTGWLELEITEHALISQAGPLVRILKQLRIQGVAVVMDDFGSGFSSLTALADLPIRGIKCDRAFVSGIARAPERQILLHHICMMGKELGLSVTVEGVETADDLGIVCKEGAGSVQGYVFARPMPHDQVPGWLESRQTAVKVGFSEMIDSMAR